MPTKLLLCLLLAAPAAATQTPPISQAQLSKLREGMDGKRGSIVPGYELSLALQLPADKTDPYHTHYNAVFFDGPDGCNHTFGYSKETGDYVLALTTKTHVKYLRIGPDLKLIAGASYKLRADDAASPIPPADAAALVEKELGLWAKRVDEK